MQDRILIVTSCHCCIIRHFAFCLLQTDCWAYCIVLCISSVCIMVSQYLAKAVWTHILVNMRNSWWASSQWIVATLWLGVTKQPYKNIIYSRQLIWSVLHSIRSKRIKNVKVTAFCYFTQNTFFNFFLKFKVLLIEHNHTYCHYSLSRLN